MINLNKIFAFHSYSIFTWNILFKRNINKQHFYLKKFLITKQTKKFPTTKFYFYLHLNLQPLNSIYNRKTSAQQLNTSIKNLRNHKIFIDYITQSYHLLSQELSKNPWFFFFFIFGSITLLTNENMMNRQPQNLTWMSITWGTRAVTRGSTHFPHSKFNLWFKNCA